MTSASVAQPVSISVKGPPAIVALVRPPVLVPSLALTAPTCPPIGVAYLAAAARRAGHHVSVIDAVGEAPDQFLPAPVDHFLVHGLTNEEIASRLPRDVMVIGISCMFSHEWPISADLIRHLRRTFPSALLVVGGEHVTALPDESFATCPEIDVIVRGEGEETFLEVISGRDSRQTLSSIDGVSTIDRGGLVRHAPARARFTTIDDIPEPAWDLIPINSYLDRGHGFGVHRGRSMPVLASRGCPYRCTFCSNASMWTTAWIPRRPEALIDEIEKYLSAYGAQNIDFYDLTAIIKRQWVVDFCGLIISRGHSFTWQLPSGTRSEVLDREVLSLLHRSGCRNISYAPESGSPRVLKYMKKKVNLSKMKASMRAAVQVGINCKANIIVGVPGETHADVWKTLRFCVEVAVLGLHDLAITPFSPYPGTEMFEELRAAGKIGPLDEHYYWALGAYSDLTSAVSWSEHLSDRAVNRYRILGMAVFYATSFALRPWRILTIMRHVLWSETQDSRLEMSLRDHLHRRRSTRQPIEI